MDLTERLRELAEPITAAEGMELVDLEYRREQGGWVVRLYIDKPGGVRLDDCQEVSGQFGARLDVEDLIPHRYRLEVSSPGLDRVLRKPADFERFAGRAVRIETDPPVDGRRRFRGRLEGVREGRVLLTTDEGKQIDLAIGQIARARLQIEP